MNDYSDIYAQAGQANGVDPVWLQAMGQQESQQDPNAVSPKGATGVMQLMPGTAKDLGVDDVTDPHQNIPAAAKYYKQQQDAYKDPNLALIAYNWGPENTKKWIANGADESQLPQETQDYVQRVNKNYQAAKSKTVQGVSEPVAYQTTQQQNSPIDVSSALRSYTPEKNSGSPAAPTNNVINVSQALRQGNTSVPPSLENGGLETYTDNTGHSYVVPKGTESAITAGLERGAKDVGNSLVRGGAWVDNKLGLTSDADYQKLKDDQTNSLNDYEKQYGKSTAAQGSRIVSSAAVATPLMGPLGDVAAGAGNLLTKAIPAAQPLVDFLGGNVATNATKNAFGQTIQKATTGNALLRGTSALTNSALQGTEATALTSAGSNQPLGDQLKTGALLGAGVKPIAEGLGAVYNKFTGQGAQGLDQATQKLYQAFQRDGYTTPEAVQNKLTELGPDATLADIGPNTRDLVGTAARAPGAGKDIAETALEERQSGQVSRLKNAALTGLGIPPGTTYEAAAEQLAKQKASNAAPFYTSAYANNPAMASSELNRILATPAGSSALKDSVRLMQNSRKFVGMSDPELVEQAKLVGSYEPGSGGIAPGLNLETLDYTKKALDRAYSNSKTTLNPKGDTSILDVKNDLLDELDRLDTTAKAGPNSTKADGGDYAKARKTFSTDATSYNALEDGTDFVKNDAAPNAAKLANLSDEDKALYRLGVAKQITKTLGDTTDTSNAAAKILNTQNKRDALRSVFPDQQSFDNFTKEVENEKEFFRTHKAVLGNSLTQPRLAAEADSQTPVQKTVSNLAAGLSHAHQLLQLNPYGKALYATKYGANKLMRTPTLAPEDYENIARGALTPQGQASTLKKITPAQQSQGRQNLLNWYVNRLVNSAGVIGGNQLLSPPPAQ